MKLQAKSLALLAGATENEVGKVGSTTLASTTYEF